MNHLKRFQNKYKLTNREMAHICNVCVRTIERWLRGDVPITGTAKRLIEVYNDPDRLNKLLRGVKR